jgi:hypothetical protein
MLEATARIAPSQPNEAMTRVAPRRNGEISLDPSCWVKIPEQVFFKLDSKLLSKAKYIQKEDWDRLFQKRSSTPRVSQSRTTRTHNFTFGVAAICTEFPWRARPSVRLCVGLIKLDLARI